MAAFLYTLLVSLHNLVRWVVIITAVWAIYRAYNGWITRREWVAADGQANRWFVNSVSLQLVLGLLLYFWPGGYVMALMGNMAAAMRDRTSRFFIAEHLVAMIIAIALIHIGAARARKAPNDGAKFRRAAIFFTIALLIIFAAIPWSWNYGRPLFRLPF